MMFGQLIEGVRACLEASGLEKRRRQAAHATAVGVKMRPHPSDVNKSFHVGKMASGSQKRRTDRANVRDAMKDRELEAKPRLKFKGDATLTKRKPGDVYRRFKARRGRR